ncbi:unnamed protein product [Macrosiphum euphorbiae]|uniref:Uncharacterized protein n=1 Tax=Macrosiphum euphorbiae TaxID=13131 RepID=A0AAV0Y7M7_9HEMI|nr:unnamed protein product [Macrosiphum euphorbiae]
MNANKTEHTPSDNPAMPANSPPEGALAHGFSGGQFAIHQRSVLSGPADEPTGDNIDYTILDSTSDFRSMTLNSDTPMGVILDAGGYVLRLRGGANSDTDTPAKDSLANDDGGTFETPYAYPRTKRKRVTDADSSLTSDGSRGARSESIERHCDEVESNIAGTR